MIRSTINTLRRSIIQNNLRRSLLFQHLPQPINESSSTIALSSSSRRSFATSRQKRASAAAGGGVKSSPTTTSTPTTSETATNIINDEEQKPSPSVSLDTGTLYNPDIHLTDKPNFDDPHLRYEKSTPLGNELLKWIAVRGPMTVADYMRLALSHPEHGYYTAKRDDLFSDDDIDDGVGANPIGRKGDFVTAPEISQLFGECLLLFFVNQSRSSSNNDKRFDFVELGPGKGTLMVDMLYAAAVSFPDVLERLDTVYLVELGDDMRALQKKALMELNDKLKVKGLNYEICFSERRKTPKVINPDQHPADVLDENNKTPDGKQQISIEWHDILSTIPTTPSHPSFIICQEFFDALPIHSFQKSSNNEWRERMVDVDSMDESPYTDMPNDQNKPRLRFVLSKGSTKSLKALMKVDDKGKAKGWLDEMTEGDIVEICPEGNMLIQDLRDRVEICGGAALIIDYGSDGTDTGRHTLRGFQKHKLVHPLTLPGCIDITANVDFGQLKRTAIAATRPHDSTMNDNNHNDDNVIIAGPVTQRHFLAGMGIVERAIALVEDDATSDEEADELYKGMELLLGDEEGQMGNSFKVMGIVKGGQQQQDADIPGFYTP